MRLADRFALVMPLSEAERRSLAALDARSAACARGATIQGEHAGAGDLVILHTGWAIRETILSDGRRQILDFVLPGDLLGIDEAILDRSSHMASAITNAKLARFRPEALGEALQHYPRLAAGLLWLSARDHWSLQQRLVALGRLSGYERVAHLIADIWQRLRERGIVDGPSFDFPPTQALLADTLGLSVVHVNRSLQRLRSDDLIETRGSEITVLDPDGLFEAAGFDPDRAAPSRMPDRLLQAALFDPGRRR